MPFGNGFYGLYQENHDFCSVVSYPARGPWGDSKYRGNCSGYLVKDLILRLKVKAFLTLQKAGELSGMWFQA
jgi:hypothetical protein